MMLEFMKWAFGRTEPARRSVAIVGTSLPVIIKTAHDHTKDGDDWTPVIDFDRARGLRPHLVLVAPDADLNPQLGAIISYLVFEGTQLDTTPIECDKAMRAMAEVRMKIEALRG